MGNTAKTILRFDGKALENHYIDINVLAPSLLAMSDMIQRANTVINGDKSKLRVQVKSDVEQRCFELELIASISLLDAARGLFADDKIATAKELLEFLGILGFPTVGVTVIWLIKKLNGKPISKEQINKNQDGTIEINVNGEKNNVSDIKIMNIYNYPPFRKSAHESFSPLSQDGIDRIEFGEKDSCETIDSQEYEKFCNYNIDEEAEEIFKPTISIKHLKIYKPTFNEKANVWLFIMNGQQIPVDISNTNIAYNIIKKGYVKVEDVYKVRLEEQEYKVKSGDYKTKYKIIEILECIPAQITEQGKLL